MNLPNTAAASYVGRKRATPSNVEPDGCQRIISGSTHVLEQPKHPQTASSSDLRSSRQEAAILTDTGHKDPYNVQPEDIAGLKTTLAVCLPTATLLSQVCTLNNWLHNIICNSNIYVCRVTHNGFSGCSVPAITS